MLTSLSADSAFVAATCNVISFVSAVNESLKLESVVKAFTKYWNFCILL
jgi:hypothetical protein